ncbi:MAG: UvrD-helicase domain-containing protein [Clostridiales bacterium]|jgi:DNA helicase-2/ATP-dependent DNA helicase PcrA|nr:UvrD-helicase domain-containing protein [Clostridiales bacterium]
MAFDLSCLNPEQLKPVLDTEGAVLVTAGAGSGKTRLLIHRIAHLIEDLGVSPYNILAITFTNKAASQMRGRLEDAIGPQRGLWVSTFHSMCASMLRSYAENIGYNAKFSIYAEAEKERTLKRIIREKNYDDDLLKPAASAISSAKNAGFDPDEYAAAFRFQKDVDLICDVYALYEKDLKTNNAFDFDDLLLKAYYLLKNVPEAAEYYTERFRYIHVDEFQDTNVIQYKIVRTLAAKHGNVFVVGDEDQSIYGWRGASIDNINDFRKDFNCKLYKLEQNYRSSEKILDAANRLIKNNSSRIKKVLWTDRKGGDEPELFPAPAENHEADFVASKILSLVRSGKYTFSDFAVLMRLNALTRSFEEKFIQYGIPHKVFGGFKFYERKEIKDILAYLRIAVNPFDNEAILRVINFPKRGIGEAAQKRLTDYCAQKNRSLFECIIDVEQNPDIPAAIAKKVAPFGEIIEWLIVQADGEGLCGLMRGLVRTLKIDEAFGEDTDENESRKQNIRELIASVEQYEIANKGATLSDYLQNVSLYTDLDEMNEDEGCVNLATVHSAKGMEFRVVFVAGLEDGIFPVSRASSLDSDMEEERRLMYVAVTRAKEKLFFTYSNSRFMYGERKNTVASRFLQELGFGVQRRASMYGEYNESRRNAFAPVVRPAPPPSPVKNAAAPVSGIKPGARVRHRKFGLGSVLSVSGEHGNTYAEIEFEGVGKLVLSINYAPLEVVE